DDDIPDLVPVLSAEGQHRVELRPVRRARGLAFLAEHGEDRPPVAGATVAAGPVLHVEGLVLDLLLGADARVDDGRVLQHVLPVGRQPSIWSRTEAPMLTAQRLARLLALRRRRPRSYQHRRRRP